MSFYTYMLRCSDNSLYTGHTDNVEHRLELHRVPFSRSYTSSRLPVRLVWVQEFPSRLEALQAERQIKGWSRAKKVALTRGDWAEIQRLARSRPSTGSGRTEVCGSKGSGRTGVGGTFASGVPRPSSASGRTGVAGTSALGVPRPSTSSGRTGSEEHQDVTLQGTSQCP